MKTLTFDFRTLGQAIFFSAASLLATLSGSAMAEEQFGITVVRDIAPEYPQSALRRDTDGLVVVRFDVDQRGKASNIEIIESEPARAFDGAVLTAVRRSAFEVVEGVEPTGFERVYRFEAGTVSAEERVRMFNAFHQ